MRFDTDNAQWIHLVWLAPVLGLLFVYGFYRRRHALELFAKSEMLGHLVSSVDRGRQVWRAALVVVAVIAIAVSVARPQWGSEIEEIQRKGIDIIVLLDLSKSMLARDAQMSRLERAKLDVEELLGAVHGDRLGLVAFAGRAEIRCPLTFDKGFFRHVLFDLDIGSVGLGGTNIADAIHKGLDCFQDEYPNYKAILLITDGEDHEAFVKEAVERARKRNVRIFSVGIGDSDEAHRVPIKDEQGNIKYLQNSKGEIVFSKMNPATLQLAANETGGAYASIGSGGFNMVDFYQKFIATLEEKELEGHKEERYKDRYQWFLGLGLLLLACEPLLPTRKSG